MHVMTVHRINNNHSYSQLKLGGYIHTWNESGH